MISVPTKSWRVGHANMTGRCSEVGLAFGAFECHPSRSERGVLGKVGRRRGGGETANMVRFAGTAS